jgi:hypothetical protein
MPSKQPNHVDSVQPAHARAPGSQAPKQLNRSATGQRGETPEHKPDEVVAQHRQEARKHLAKHDERSDDSDEATEDAEHGYSQDAGYAQSGGPPDEDADANPKPD